MSIVDRELQRIDGEEAFDQVKALTALTRDLEAHCEAMAAALRYFENESHMDTQTAARYQWEQFKKERSV